MDISIVVPVYFNEGSIEKTYASLEKEIFKSFPELEFEVIFIDDGSRDDSFNEILRIKEKHQNVQAIQFTRNFGQVAAIYAGYEAANGEGILNIAADMQEPTSLIRDMIKSFNGNEAPIILGQRADRDESRYRKITSRFFYRTMRRLSFANMPDGGFDVALISKEVRDRILDLDESNPFWQGQILWTGYPVKFIPYSRQKRKIGRSKWSFSKKIKYLLDGILNYSYAPLRFFAVIGIISFLLGILYSIVIIVQYFLGGSPFTGWA